MSKKQFEESKTKKGYYGYRSETGTSSPKNKKNKNRKSTIISGILAVIQMLVSIGFIAQLFYKNISLSTTMLAGLISILIILLAIPFALALKNSIGAKRVGKVISILVILILAALIYFISPLTKMSGKKVSEEPFVVYVSADDSFGEEVSKNNARSDTNILGIVNPKTHTVLMVSTPRDYYVEVAAKSIAPQSFDKLTHVGMYGNGIAYDNNGNEQTASDWDWAGNTNWGQGNKALMDTLKNLYDINVTSKDYHYVKINFTGFAELIDNLGGVTVDVEQAFSTRTYASYGNVDNGKRKTYVYNKGPMKMDGATALTFARERHSFSNGDIQRNKNQIKVIKAIADEILTAKTILNYNSIIKSIETCFATDMDLSSLATLQMQVMGNKDYNGWNIYSFSTTGVAGRGILTWNGLSKSIVTPDEASVANAKELINMVLTGAASTEVEAKVNEYSE